MGGVTTETCRAVYRNYKKLYIVASYWTIIDIAPMFGFPYEILHVSLQNLSWLDVNDIRHEESPFCPLQKWKYSFNERGVT